MIVNAEGGGMIYEQGKKGPRGPTGGGDPHSERVVGDNSTECQNARWQRKKKGGTSNAPRKVKGRGKKWKKKKKEGHEIMSMNGRDDLWEPRGNARPAVDLKKKNQYL